MQLPSEQEKREKLINYINSAAEEKLIIDAANSHLSDMRKAVKEEFGISPKEFNGYVKAWIDDDYVQKSFDEIEELFHNVEILKGMSDD